MYHFETGECEVCVKWGLEHKYMALPCYAEEISESLSSLWQSQQIVGRTDPIYAYTGNGSMTSSFSFDLHREMTDPSGNSYEVPGDYIDSLVALIKSGCYPRYSAGSTTDDNGNTQNISGLTPPRVMWKFGDMCISGIMMSVEVAWKLPIIKKQYSICNIRVQMTSVHTSIIDAKNIYNKEVSVRGGSIQGDMSKLGVSYPIDQT